MLDAEPILGLWGPPPTTMLWTALAVGVVLFITAAIGGEKVWGLASWLLLGAVGFAVAAYGILNTSLFADTGTDAGAGRRLAEAGVPAAIVESAGDCITPSREVYPVGCEVLAIAHSTEWRGRIHFERLTTVGGHWRGSGELVLPDLPDVIPVESRDEDWGETLSAESKEIRPWLEVTIPAIDASLLHETLRGDASLTVHRPLSTGVTTFRNDSERLSREVGFFVVSADELNLFHSTTSRLNWWQALAWVGFALVFVFFAYVGIDEFRKARSRRG